jgi:hypothetical protein
MKKILPVALVMFLLGCSGQNEFERFSSQADPMQTPISFNTSGLIKNQTQQKHEDAAFSLYAPSGADQVLGKLYEDDQTTGIVYIRSGDVPVPILMTYTREGVKIDSLNLFEFNPEDGELNRLVTFLPDRKIQLIDSVTIWSETFPEEDSDLTEAIRMQQLSVDTVLHVIDRSGKIIKGSN